MTSRPTSAAAPSAQGLAGRAVSHATPAPSRHPSAIAITSGCAIIIARRDGVAANARAMSRDQVEPAVAEAVLLRQIARQALTPPVDALRLAANHQAVAGGGEAIAQVVVVPVSKRLVQQPDATHCGEAPDDVARADMVRRAAVDARVPLLEVHRHDPRQHRRPADR